METLEKDEFMKAYRSIVSQLKRKFVRRPNVVEAIEAYESLGRQQADLGFTELSAACRLAAARLEQAVNSSAATQTSRSSEYQLFLDSARSYSKVPDKATTFLCYEAAISSSTDESIAWMTAMEAGEKALKQEDYATSIHFLNKGFQLVTDEKGKKITGEKLASAYIRHGLLADALKTLQSLKSNRDSEITQILLVLNLKNHSNGESKTSQMIKFIIEEPMNIAPAELNYTISSLVKGEVNDLTFPIIWKYLNKDQQQLFFSLVVSFK